VKSLAVLAQENQANIDSVREGKIEPAVLENGTITLSNLGKYPITRFTAIINPPQSCILAIGCIQPRPAWAGGQWTEKSVLCITASFDHRVVDGAYGAEFLARLKEILEHPDLLLI
jgi:pyruvate dehydrogenase E2 component (dihydrolipoamide acetyltransferase)